MILAVVIVYLIFICVLGVVLRNRIHGFADFMVAGRSAGLVVVAASFVGSHFGGGMTVGGAELGARNGLSGVWYGLACGFSYLLLLVIVKKIYALKQMTIADVLEHVYGTKRVRAIFAIIAFVGTVGIIGGQILAGRAMFATFGVSPELGGVITFLIIVVYCALSGLYGVMITDTIQVAIGGFGVVLGTVLAVNKIGGLSALSALPAQELSIFPQEMSTLVWLVVPTTLLGLVSQPSYQRVNACQDEKTAVRAPLLAAFVVMALAVFPVLAGMCANILWPDVEPAMAVPRLLQEVFPPVVAAIFIAAILAAIMSTADSVLLAGVANVVRDFYQQIFRPDASDKELLRISTVATVAIGARCPRCHLPRSRDRRAVSTFLRDQGMWRAHPRRGRVGVETRNRKRRVGFVRRRHRFRVLDDAQSDRHSLPLCDRFGPSAHRLRQRQPSDGEGGPVSRAVQ